MISTELIGVKKGSYMRTWCACQDIWDDVKRSYQGDVTLSKKGMIVKILHIKLVGKPHLHSEGSALVSYETLDGISGEHPAMINQKYEVLSGDEVKMELLKR